MLDYIEKRDYIRMAIDCKARIEFQGIEPLEATIKDLSATGLLMEVGAPIPSGSIGSVSVIPGKNITPPLHAEIEIVRCLPAKDNPSVYMAACTIKEIHKVNAA